MSPVEVLAALLSAGLSAGWNAAVKASARPAGAMAAQMILAGLLALPGLALTGLPAAACLPFVLGSVLGNLVAVSLLTRAYAHGGFGATFPVARAVSVLLVVPLSALVAGERPGPGALAGALLIVGALGLLAAEARGRRTPPAPAAGRPGLALAYTVGTGVAVAAAVLCDALGARAGGSAMAYGLLVAALNAAVGALWQRGAGSPFALVRAHLALALPAAVAALASYLLILWVFANAPVAPAAALRDTSAVFALLIAVVWFEEPFTRARLAAVVLAIAAVPLLRLA